jgi:hypothetical protein
MPVRSTPALMLETEFRSGSEEKVAAQLTAAGVAYAYEDRWVHYKVPERAAKYKPDFPIKDTNILIEVKGRFGGPGRWGTDRGAEERQKLILLKEQHPELDIRLVFDRSSTKIYKGSKTTYAKWADDHGFKWADKTRVPPEWIAEILKAQK